MTEAPDLPTAAFSSLAGPDVVLVRHGETEWSRTGRHTGRTDVPLTDEGRRQAEVLGAHVSGHDFVLVLTSPLSRARETCVIAGLGEQAEVDERLVEWDYGDYEGVTTAEIRQTRPGWTVWAGGCPGGESVDEVGARADAVIERVRAADGDVALFAHGHVLRVLAARWLGLAPVEGRLLALDTATLCVLGYERETPVLARWNLRPPSA
jgi:broad specificity phosphatase PhoE